MIARKVSGIEMLRPAPTRQVEGGILVDRRTLASALQLLASSIEDKPLDPNDGLLHMTAARLALVVHDLLLERRASGNG